MTAQTDEEQIAARLEEQKIDPDQPVVEDDDDDEDDEEEEEDKDDEEMEGQEGTVRLKTSKSEKKSRKAMLKLGMKPIPGAASDTYVIFGDAKIEDLSSQLQSQAAEQFKAPDVSHIINKPESLGMAQDDEDVDETGVEPKDIELVMTQAGVSRAKAVKSLKAADGDIVSAIMELTN
ncbi:hypothetical protein Sjap_002049 [Stephania japonica]|uniref:Nascent polypeptide-associated complex subunit alpha-like UBA domain-containing protein n=1 Tax=Stephania japonica TaxID=461633 RepID=A0AAP0PU47_9MAGN